MRDDWSSSLLVVDDDDEDGLKEENNKGQTIGRTCSRDRTEQARHTQIFLSLERETETGTYHGDVEQQF